MTERMRTKRECKSCGEVLPWDRKSSRCEECDDERHKGIIPTATTLMHDAGGGTRVIRSGKEMT